MPETPDPGRTAYEARFADLDAEGREEPPLHSFCINPVGGPNIRAEGTDRFTTEAEALAYANWARATIAALRTRATAAEQALREKEAEVERLPDLAAAARRALKSRGYPERPIVTDVVTLDLTVEQAAALAALAQPDPTPASSEEATDVSGS